MRLLTLGFMMCLLAASASAADMKPNILYIMTDDQAPWSLGAYGNRESQSPVLDKLASEGTRFSHAFVVTPVCSPSRATFMTGLHSTQFNIPDWITPEQAKKGLGLDPKLPTWPKVLHEAGYRTGLVGKWHLGNLSPFHPTANGFDFFRGHLDGGWNPKDPTLEIDGKQTKIDGYSVDRTADDAIHFLKQADQKPFLLCVQFREPHTPYVPVPEADAQLFKSLDPTIPSYPQLKLNQVKTWTRQYYASVHAIDRNVGRILKQLQDLNLHQSTIVIFTSDHGYNIGHHGIHTKGNGHWCTTDQTGVRPNMWDTSCRIPLIIRWPGTVKAAMVQHEMITSEDIFPTIVAMAGLNPPPSWKGQGKSFLPLLQGKPYQPREAIFGQYDITNTAKERMRMIRTHDWKLVRHYLKPGTDELFDLKLDPEELVNRYADKQAAKILDALQKQLDQWMQSIGDSAGQ